MIIEPISPVSPALAGKFFTTSATWEALSFTYICSSSLSCNYSVLGLPLSPTATKQVRCNICLSPQASPCPAHLPEPISLLLSLPTPNTPPGPLSLSLSLSHSLSLSLTHTHTHSLHSSHTPSLEVFPGQGITLYLYILSSHHSGWHTTK